MELVMTTSVYRPALPVVPAFELVFNGLLSVRSVRIDEWGRIKIKQNNSSI